MSEDKELQKLIFESLDDGSSIGRSDDAEYYKMIRNALEAEPVISLPEDFAEKVTLKAVRRKNVFILYKSTALYFGVFVLMLVTSGIAFYFLAKETFFQLLSGLQAFKYPIIFAIAVFSLIQIMDEILIRNKKIKIYD